MRHVLIMTLLSLMIGAVHAFATEERTPVYLLAVKGTTEIIYVDAPKPFSYQFHVYKGEPGKLVALNVERVMRRRDGGTTTIIFEGHPSINIPAQVQNEQSVVGGPSRGQEFVFKALTPESLASYQIDPTNPLKGSKPNPESAATEAASIENLDSNALDATGVQVDEAFRDDEGNLIVRFCYGAECIGSNLMFWGPRHEGRLYQLKQKNFMGRAQEYTLSVLAPTTTDAERQADIKVGEDGRLVVSCEEASHCFKRISEPEARGLEVLLRLEGLPKTRAVVYSFKIMGTDTYVVVDSPKFNFGYGFEVFIGENRNLRPVKVADVTRYRDGGTTYVTLADGRIIFSPSRFGEERTAKLFDSKSDKVGQVLEEQSRNVEFLASIGLDTGRFKIPELRTPVTGAGRCAAFLAIK